MSISPFPFEAYYYSPLKSYLVLDAQSQWMAISEKSLLLRLVGAKFSRKPKEGEALNAVELMLLRIQAERNVIYAGPLAGYDIGLHKQNGCQVLVTRPPTYIEAVPGDWSVLRALIAGMFTSPDADQTPWFHLWLKCADASFRAKSLTPGPALAMAGPGKSGKTMLSRVITLILGGRSASPHRYMCGNSQFNSELIGSEVLVIDDEQPSKDLRTRRAFGNHIKNMLFGAFQSSHGKSTNAFTLCPFWRMLILINDEPENLLVLPPIDESLEDKLVLFKINLCPMPMAASTPLEQTSFWKVLQAEIPCYLHWLRHEFKLSPSHPPIDSRTGCVNYKHPDLLAQITELAPETIMLRLLDAVLFPDGSGPPYTRSAEEIVRLLHNSEFQFEASRLLNWSNAAGTYLGRLSKSHPERVIQVRQKDSRLWKILSPDLQTR